MDRATKANGDAAARFIRGEDMTGLATTRRTASRPGRRPRALGALAATLVAAALASCAGHAPAPGATSAPTAAGASESERRIASDLVGVLARVDEVAPGAGANVRVTARDDEPGFAAALEGALREAGYAVIGTNASAGPGGAVPAGYAVQRGEIDGVATATYTIALADVQARRSWAPAAGGGTGPDADWVPAGPLYVRGADVGGIEPARSPAAPDATPDPAGRALAPETVSTPTRSATRTATAPERIAIDPATGSPVYGGLTREALGGASLPTARNVMDLGDSNFADLFVDYADVTERILVFPNDSERLGPDNKSIVTEVAGRFDPERDVISIVGCSLGPTALPNGNERLALGRANRVKEELVLVGVPSERIVDEGCWAGDSSERFPSRGVVLTLRRQG